MNDCCCADIFSDGEIKVVFQAHSEVPNKHKKGGQSAKRFSQIRDNEITHWFKRINEYLKNIEEEYYLGISSIYKNRFINTLNTYNKNKIKEVNGTEYANLTGVYQYINMLNNR